MTNIDVSPTTQAPVLGPDGVPEGTKRYKLKSGASFDIDYKNMPETSFTYFFDLGVETALARACAKIKVKDVTGDALVAAHKAIMDAAIALRKRTMEGALGLRKRASSKKAAGISQELHRAAKAIALRKVKDELKHKYKKKISSYTTADLSKAAESWLQGPEGPSIYQLAQQTLDMLAKGTANIKIDVSALKEDPKLVERNAKAAEKRKATAKPKAPAKAKAKTTTPVRPAPRPQVRPQA